GRVARAGAAARALGALLAALARRAGLAHGPHAGDVRRAAAGDGLHHLRGLLETLPELVDVGDGHARALGDAQTSRSVEDLRVASLARGHRADDRLGAVDLALVEVLELLLHLPHARQHAEHLLH